jgi:hypothetical protein
MKNFLTLMMLAVFFVSCSSGHKKDAKAFEKLLEAETGESYKIVKLDTEKGDYVVYKNTTTGEYVAFNMANFNRDTATTLETYYSTAVEGVDIVRTLDRDEEWVDSGYYEDEYETRTYYDEYFDDDCSCYRYEEYTESVWVGQYWVDTSHWYTFYTGGGFRFSNTQTGSKDLETLAALKEDVKEKLIKHTLTSDFSLSETRSSELAKMLSRYQKLENSRELTIQEKDSFTMDALGVSYTKIESALKEKAQGNQQSFKSLLDEASKVNNTTPEQIDRFFDQYIDEI